MSSFGNISIGPLSPTINAEQRLSDRLVWIADKHDPRSKPIRPPVQQASPNG